MLDEMARPALGVYAVRAGIADGAEIRWLDGVANLGVRPTFGGSDVLLEAHLFDFDGDLYGRHLRVVLIEHLRGEKKFDGIDALKAQIVADCAHARRILATAETRGEAALKQGSGG
jgi:riboflavin kinase/FMN adenylyltransferase